MKKFPHALVYAAAVASTGMGSVAMAESPLTANIGVASNYIWRGVSQTQDASAISGGIDYAHSSGFYVGTWVSNESWTATPGYEQDLYAGYGGKAGPVSYDVSYIAYTYPVGDAKDDFSEVILNLGYGPVTLTYAPTVDKEAEGSNQDDVYMSIAAEFEVRKDLMLQVLYGSYDYDGGSAADYKHIHVSLSKNDFSFAYDKVDPEVAGAYNDDPRFTVSWSKSFDL